MFLLWCGCVFVVVRLCFCGGVVGFCSGAVVFLWWCGYFMAVVFLLGEVLENGVMEKAL